MIECAIFDIDGTLANNGHRQMFLKSKPKNWVAYQAGILNDTPHDVIVDLLHVLSNDGTKIILCSGRGEQERAATEQWLGDVACIWKTDYEKLYMRPEGDYRADDIIKEELLAQIRADGFNPTIVFDDRNRVVDMWRRVGLVCCQVAPGDF